MDIYEHEKLVNITLMFKHVLYQYWKPKKRQQLNAQWCI
jgi:hypothetical protein